MGSYLFKLVALSAVLSGTFSGAETYKEIREQIFSVHCFKCHSGDTPSGSLDLSKYSYMMDSNVIVPGDPDTSYLMERVILGEMPKDGPPLPPEKIEMLRAWILAGAPDAPPAVTAEIKQVVPRVGALAGGETVRLEGNFLSGVKEVFFGEAPCRDVTIVSDQAVTCLTPERAGPGLVAVRVKGESGEAKLENAFEYRRPLVPTYESIREHILVPRCLGCHSGPRPPKQLDLSTLASTLAHRRAVFPFNAKDSRVYKKTREGEMPKGGPRLPAEQVRVIRDWIEAGAPER